MRQRPPPPQLPPWASLVDDAPIAYAILALVYVVAPSPPPPTVLTFAVCAAVVANVFIVAVNGWTISDLYNTRSTVSPFALSLCTPDFVHKMKRARLRLFVMSVLTERLVSPVTLGTALALILLVCACATEATLRGVAATSELDVPTTLVPGAIVAYIALPFPVDEATTIAREIFVICLSVIAFMNYTIRAVATTLAADRTPGQDMTRHSSPMEPGKARAFALLVRAFFAYYASYAQKDDEMVLVVQSIVSITATAASAYAITASRAGSMHLFEYGLVALYGATLFTMTTTTPLLIPTICTFEAMTLAFVWTAVVYARSKAAPPAEQEHTAHSL